MKSIILLSVAAAIIALTQGAVIDESSTYDFTRTEKLSDEFTATWSVSEAKQEIEFKIVAKTAGWVQIGISNTNEQMNADLVLGGVDGKNKYAKDMYGDIAGILWEDTKPDWKLVDAIEDATAGTTTLTVSRPFDTKDPNANQDIKIENKNIYLLWSFGQDDDITRPYLKRGFLQVNLLENKDPEIRSTTDGASALSTVSFTLALATLLVRVF